MYREAEAELRRTKDLLRENVIVVAAMGRACAVSGNRAEATRIMDELKAPKSINTYPCSYLLRHRQLEFALSPRP